ncbi:MAG: DUF3880 domain-containing protein [Lachnospiraceae bacterium]|nr:DUF3880 domain-containing protein [Lachnospiraceae bacterium]
MRILIYKWRAYNYRDIYETFLAMGHTLDVMEQKLKSYDEDAEFEARLTHILKETSYDFVFTVNYFAVISNVCERCKVKYVSWSCDNPLISMYHKSVFHDCNYIFLFDKRNFLEFKARGVPHVYYLPLAVDTVRMDHLLAEADDLRLYQNEVSFVGSLYERNTYDKIKNTLPDYLRGYLDAVMQAQMSVSGANIIEEMLTPDILEAIGEHFSLEKSQDSFSDLGLIFSTTVLGFKIAAMQRTNGLLALSKHVPVTIYTNSNTKNLLRVTYRGSVDYWTQMPKVFHMSKINLNFTIPNIYTGLPLRMWDILGAGGFLMTNYQAELPDFFVENKDLVCFDGEKDLVEKTLYYLSHEEERKQIARNGHEKVKKFHTYQIRLKEIIETIENSRT